MGQETKSSSAAFRQEVEPWRLALLQRVATFTPRRGSGRTRGWSRTISRDPQNPEEHKNLQRIYQNMLELERLEDLDLLKENGSVEALRILKTGDPATLRLDEGTQLLNALDRVLVQYADEKYLCRRTTTRPISFDGACDPRFDTADPSARIANNHGLPHGRRTYFDSAFDASG